MNNNIVEDSFARKVLIRTSIGAIIILCIATVINILLKLPLELILANAGGIILFLICFPFFKYTRNKSTYIFFKWLFSIGSIAFLDGLWYFNYGSEGPILYTLLILLTLLVLIWNGTGRIIILIFFFLNVISLFILEYQFPGMLDQYNDVNSRLLDIYLGYFLYAGLMAAIVISIKKSYVEEKEKAQQSDKLKTVFLTNLSHEIRTPMNAIIGFSDLLEFAETPEKSKKYIGLITENGNSLLRIIDDIIEVSKIESGEKSLHIKDIELKVLLNEFKSYFNFESKRAFKSNLEFIIDSANKDILFKSDMFKIRQIISALLNNSIKFSEKGKVHLKVEFKNNQLLFSIRDQGKGIPHDKFEKIFDKFYKLETNDTLLQGTGIGLAIAKDLTELLKGKIWLESEVGKGSEFFVQIPIKRIN